MTLDDDDDAIAIAVAVAGREAREGEVTNAAITDGQRRGLG